MKIRLAILAISISAMAACGGDDDGGLSCENFEACGGDPVGEWEIDDTCFGDEDFNPFEANCPASTFEYGDINQTGSVTINDNGSYTISTTFDVAATAFIPLSCLNGLTCAVLSMEDDIDCTTNDADDGCDCDVSISDTDSENGTWTVSGNTLTVTADGEAAETSEFCVSGDQMTVFNEGMEEGEPDSTILLGRK